MIMLISAPLASANSVIAANTFGSSPSGPCSPTSTSGAVESASSSVGIDGRGDQRDEPDR